MLNYAHRGFSEAYPENTIIAFDEGIRAHANALETDLRATRDGALVLFHDESLLRVTGQNGRMEDLTLAEAQSLFICHKDPSVAPAPLCTLQTFLARYAHRSLTLALELKTPGIAADTLREVRSHAAEADCVITSFDRELLRDARRANETIRLGYLCKTLDGIDEILHDLRATEICPHADLITEEVVARFHAKHLGVRAYGVADTACMERLVRLGVDGMTVNFPQKLYNFLKKQ